MILRTYRLPNGRGRAVLSQGPHGYRTTLTPEGGLSPLVGRDWSPRSRAKAFAHFLELCTATRALEDLYPIALAVISEAAANLNPSRQRSLVDGALSLFLRGHMTGPAPAARALRRLAAETGDARVRALAEQVETMAAVARGALPTAVSAPLDAEIGAVL